MEINLNANEIQVKESRILFLNKNDILSHRSIIIPYGSIVTSALVNKSRFPKIDIKIDTNKVGIQSLSIKANDKYGQQHEAMILPPYYDEEILDIKKGEEVIFKSVKFKLWAVIEEKDKIQAAQLINKSHYLTFPLSGMIIGCGFVDKEIQKKIINKISNNADNVNKEQNMIGCVILSNLYHGNPLGRKEILRNENEKQLIKKWNERGIRKLIVEKVGLGWCSRFAVDEPYRNIKLGTLLAKHALKIALRNRFPNSKYLEVITTREKRIAERILASYSNRDQIDLFSKGGDFLINASYNLVPETRHSKPQYEYDYINYIVNRNKKNKKQFYKLYYYAKCYKNE